MLSLYILFGISVFLYYFVFRKKRRGKAIPGPWGVPFIGKGLEVKSERVHEQFSRYAEQYGAIFQVKLFFENIICLNSADLIRKAFGEDPYKRHMNDRSPTFWGKYILHDSQSTGFYPNAYGGSHGDLKKGLTRALHFLGEGNKELEDRTSQELCRLHKTIDEMDEKDFEFIAVIKRSLSNIVAFLLSGEDLRDNNNDVDLFWKVNKADEQLLNADTNTMLLAFPFLVKISSHYRKIYMDGVEARDRLLRKYFTEVQKTHRPGVVRGIVDLFLDEQATERASGRDVVFTDERIKNTVIETITTGIVTSFSSIASTVLCILHHPEYQDRLQKELDTVIGRDRMPSISDRANCPFLEAIVTESNRLLPIAPLLLPHVCQTELEFDGYHVPAGCQTYNYLSYVLFSIIPNVWHVHHDGAVWGDPWKFRPERWLDENGQALSSTHPLRKHWITFGTGTRQCPGEQFARNRIFLYLASLFKTYRFIGTPGKFESLDPREGGFKITGALRPKPYFCKAKRRD